jgi:hypothetical protein
MSRNYYDVQTYQSVLIRDEDGRVTECDYEIDHDAQVVRMRDDLTLDRVFDAGYDFGRQMAERQRATATR